MLNILINPIIFALCPEKNLQLNGRYGRSHGHSNCDPLADDQVVELTGHSRHFLPFHQPPPVMLVSSQPFIVVGL